MINQKLLSSLIFITLASASNSCGKSSGSNAAASAAPSTSGSAVSQNASGDSSTATPTTTTADATGSTALFPASTATATAGGTSDPAVALITGLASGTNLFDVSSLEAAVSTPLGSALINMLLANTSVQTELKYFNLNVTSATQVEALLQDPSGAAVTDIMGVLNKFLGTAGPAVSALLATYGIGTGTSGSVATVAATGT